MELIWKTCLDGVGKVISPQHFATWFKPIRLLSAGEATLELEVPNRFFLEWIKEHYIFLIQELVRKSARREVELVWRVADEADGQGNQAREPSRKKGPAPKAQKAGVEPSGLSSKYTFDTFVVGKANEFAHAAAFAVAGRPANKYNPLFIYGDAGLGKTHLLQAIGHRVLETDSDTKVCYYTSERFMNEFINYVSRKKMSDFRNKFRNVDVLLIDDIQFWTGKVRTQEEFFHTFNTLYEGHKQIVVTSDKFPKDIDGIEDRLRSRFEWGLIADIQPPDMETKIAILKKKARMDGIKLPDDVAELVAGMSGSNIRELEGYLNRVIAVSSLAGQDIGIDMAKAALKNLLKDDREKTPGVDQILKTVACFYNVKVADLKSKRRLKTIALPRQVAMYMAREIGRLSYPEIGTALGGKDHSTAIHAVKKIEKAMKENNDFKRSLDSIKKSMGVA